jgi:L-threonylcarbamoyladenylate synthase
MIDEPSTLYDFGVASSELLRAVVETFWPGPLTLVVVVAPDRVRFAPGIENSAAAVGFRCSDHPVAGSLVREACERGLGPLTATSFNRTGETPVQTRSEAVQLAKLYESHEVRVLNSDAPEDSVQTPSTVLDLSGGEPRVLRWGAVPEQALAPLLDRFC